MKNFNVDEFKRTGNWYSIKVDNTKYNVIIQKGRNSYNCEPSSIIVFDENLVLIEPHKSKRRNLYDEIEEVMNKVDFKYDIIDED